MDNDKIVCFVCEAVETEDMESFEARRGHTYCSSCFDEEFRVECADCNDMIERNDSIEDDGDLICSSCYDNRENDNGNFSERVYSSLNLPAFQNKLKGNYVTSERVFSAELECFYPDNRTVNTVTRSLDRAIGVSDDGSLGRRGIEFQTPKLKGKAGEDAIKAICKTLNANDFTIQRSAGLHIHLDAAGLVPKRRTKDKPVKLVSMFTFYIAFEDVILSLLPKSRRGNQYCTVMKNEFSTRELHEVYTLEQLEKIWYRCDTRKTVSERKGNKYDNSRYLGVNLHSLFANKHLEVRYHSGTLDATKILEWVNLHQTIMDKAVSGDLWGQREVANFPSLAEKTQLFFDVLKLPERAEQYFRSRQTMFNDVQVRQEEDSLEVVAIAQ